MATSKPRITISLTKHQHAILKSIADSGGASMSGMLGEFIESAMPTFERMAATFQQLRKANDKERARIAEALGEVQTALEPIAMEAVGQWDLFLSQGAVNKVAVAGRSRTEEEPTGGGDLSPLTNRGVTPKTTTPSKASSTSVLKPVLKKKVLKKDAVKMQGKNHAV